MNYRKWMLVEELFGLNVQICTSSSLGIVVLIKHMKTKSRFFSRIHDILVITQKFNK